jgi:photosystem II stability/assembly factor-like uncharacterized protein
MKTWVTFSLKQAAAICSLSIVLCFREVEPQTDFWRPAGLANHTIFSLVVDPHGHLFAGTADSGVYRSTDSGDHWTNVTGGRVQALAVARDSSILAGYFHRFIARSSDDGITWSIVGFPTASIWSIYVAPEGEIFAGIFASDDSVGGLIYRSSDNGETWERVKDGPPHALMLSFVSLGNEELLTGSRGGAIFIDKPPPNEWFFDSGIYRSSDGGDHWTSTDLDSGEISSMAVASNEHVFAGSHWYGVYRSTDKGKTWVQNTNGLTGLYERNIRSMVVLSNDIIYIATLAGVYFSTDDGNQWNAQNAGLADLSVNSIACDSMGFLYVGTNSGVYRSLQTATSVHDAGSNSPLGFSLSNNYPNPFNPSTTIEFSVPKASFVTLKIYNTMGQEVSTLVSQNLKAGTHKARWNAIGVSSGIYCYRLQTMNEVITKKMALVR